MRRIALAGLVLALGLAGCGDSKSKNAATPTSTPDSLPKATQRAPTAGERQSIEGLLADYTRAAAKGDGTAICALLTQDAAASESANCPSSVVDDLKGVSGLKLTIKGIKVTEGGAAPGDAGEVGATATVTSTSASGKPFTFDAIYRVEDAKWKIDDPAISYVVPEASDDTSDSGDDSGDGE